jgi:DNA-binding Lrp family transcriptional regulator
MNLNPEMDKFRSLTKPDFKLLEFITTKGTASSIKKLSQMVKMTTTDIASRINEYKEAHLIHRTTQFFNIGLDLNIYFYISSPKEYNINWIQNLSTFAKMDLYYNESEKTDTLFGFMKLPSKWYRDFGRKIAQMKDAFPELKFYYTIEPPKIARWNLLLSETYSGR